MKITFGGGLNEQQAPDINEAYRGSYNFELSKDRNALIPRSAFDLKATVPNAGDIRGIMQLIKRDDSETTLIQAGNVVYSWDGSTTFTNKGSPSATSQLRDCYWSLDDFLVITDLQKLTPVSKWDGTTFSTLTTGLASTLYAKYAIVHNGRVWMFNVKTSTDTPHLMVASAFEDPTSYDTTLRASADGAFTTGLEAFYMTTPDLKPINGVTKTLAGDLIISTERGSLFRLTGFDATTYQWSDFYPGSECVGNESMASMGNDIIYMKRHGSIDALSATQNYGDVAADDISRWIASTVQGLDAAITVYDQYRQKVYFFVEDKVLVLFKDILYGGALVGERGERAKISPWSVYRTSDSSSFNTNAAKYIRVPSTSSYSTYFGGTDGRIFDINGSGLSGDAGSADITVVRKTRLITEEDGIKFRKHILRGDIQYRRLNDIDFNINFDWADEYNQSPVTLRLHGSGQGTAGVYYGGEAYYAGPYYYNQGGTSFLDKVTHKNFSAVGRGPGCFITCSTTDVLPYQVENLELL